MEIESANPVALLDGLSLVMLGVLSAAQYQVYEVESRIRRARFAVYLTTIQNGGLMPISKKIQEIIDAVSSDRQSLLDSIGGLSDAQINHKQEGQWSISDILHHLALTDEANVKLISRMLKQAEALALPTDPTPDGSEIDSLAPFAEALKNRVQAPEFVRPHEHAPVEQSLARLEASRKRFVEVVEQLGQYDLSLLKYPHPLLGELNLYQWLVIAGGHERRHANQINRIKSEPDFPQ